MMKFLKISLMAMLTFFAVNVTAQSLNDEELLSEEELVDANSLIEYLDMQIFALDNEITNRLDGKNEEGLYSYASTDELICYYECLYAMKPVLKMYVADLELLNVLYDTGDNRDDAKDRIDNTFFKILEKEENCECMRGAAF